MDDLSEIITRAMNSRERELKIAVIDAMTTNETLWFRDTYPFEVLSDSYDLTLEKNKPNNQKLKLQP